MRSSPPPACARGSRNTRTNAALSKWSLTSGSARRGVAEAASRMVVAARIRHTLAWVACAAGLLGLLIPLVQQPVGWGPRMVIAGIALCAAVRPPVALLVLLPLQAIAETLFVAVRANSIGLRYVEALTVAFLAGWALRQSTRSDRIHVDGWTHTWVQALGIAALASVLIDLVIQVAEMPGEA